MFGRLKKYGKWGELAEESELLAIEAEGLQDKDASRCRELYLQAARLEEEVVGLIPEEKFVFEVYGSFIVSAVVLYYKAGNFIGARRIITEHRNKIQDSYNLTKLEEIIGALDEQK